MRPRKSHRLEHVFVSHTHIDHFYGFDRLLKVLAGRKKKLNLYGPPDFIDQVEHKLHAYRWNLTNRYLNDLIFAVTEIDCSLGTRSARFRLKNAFAMHAWADGGSCVYRAAIRIGGPSSAFVGPRRKSDAYCLSPR